MPGHTLRRTIVPALAAGAAAAAETAVAAIPPKESGETRIIAAVGGDYGHNSIPIELHLRHLFAPNTDWRLLFVQGSRFFTPELLVDADLLITSRHGRTDDINWRTDGIVDSMDSGDHFWSDENCTAIIENVRRGMGFMALHNSLMNRNNDLTEMLDVTPIMHNEVQPLWVRDLNREHPVTRGLGDFFINLDEQFAAVIHSEHTTTLFETTAMHDKRNAVGGWCLGHGDGRVIALLPGHGTWAYRAPTYQEILWRAAYWAMQREIPPFHGNYYKPTSYQRP